jgi:monothiol glutaredoxin
MPNDAIRQEIEREVAANTILVYGKGTKDRPLCGFTLETIEFFNRFGYPFELIDVLDDELKREELSQVTNWATLPKVFIDGTFYGDTDILEPMAESGELQKVLAEAFAGKAEPAPSIHLH